MKKAKYISNPHVYMMLIWTPIVFGIITLILHEVYGALLDFFIALLFTIFLIILRKRFFLKMMINEFGITTLYRNKIVKQLKWEDIKYALAVPSAQGGYIWFVTSVFCCYNFFACNSIQ